MNTKYQPLFPVYKEYYEKMAKEYCSENERVFFETMKERQQHVFTQMTFCYQNMITKTVSILYDTITMNSK